MHGYSALGRRSCFKHAGVAGTLIATLHSRFLRERGLLWSLARPMVLCLLMLLFLGSLFVSSTRMSTLSGLTYMVVTFIGTLISMVCSLFFFGRMVHSTTWRWRPASTARACAWLLEHSLPLSCGGQ